MPADLPGTGAKLDEEVVASGGNQVEHSLRDRTGRILWNARAVVEPGGLGVEPLGRHAAQRYRVGARWLAKQDHRTQIRALLRLDLTTWWRAYLTTAILYGLRPGELLGLRWEDVDFKAGVIRVRKCLKALPDPEAGKRRLVLETLKTDQSKRTVRMPKLVVPVLLALRKEQAAARLKLGADYDVRGLSIVFGDRAGAPRWPQDVRRDFKTLCGRAGVGENWTPREQRHTFVSVLSDSGVSIEDIADAVGHINSTVTKAVYRHVIADEITVAATAMDAIFGGAGGSPGR